MFKKILMASVYFYCINTSAALNGYSCISRANCINNETVAWDATTKWRIFIRSYHNYGEYMEYGGPAFHTKENNEHIMIAGWRSAAVDWFEGGIINHGMWHVMGYCDRYVDYDWERKFSSATNCNLYDGWWNWSPPDDEKSNNKNEIENKTTNAMKINLSKLDELKYGIHIVASNEMPDYPFNMKKSEKGYEESDSTFPHYLMALEEKQRKTWVDPALENKPSYSGIKKEKKNVPLTFIVKDFNLPGLRIIGYSGMITHTEDNKWTGLTEDFYINDDVCVLSITDYRKDGILIIDEQRIKYIVNNKPSTTYIEGSEKTGFIYSVAWFNMKDSLSYDLRCVNLKYDTSMIKKVISYANAIDKQI